MPTMLTDKIRARVKEAMKARRTVEKEILKVVLGDVETPLLNVAEGALIEGHCRSGTIPPASREVPPSA